MNRLLNSISKPHEAKACKFTGQAIQNHDSIDHRFLLNDSNGLYVVCFKVCYMVACSLHISVARTKSSFDHGTSTI
jgi:hypothetical protein